MQLRELSLCLVMLVALSSVAIGDVFNMGDGLTSLEFVTVGDPGNDSDDEVMWRDGTTEYGRVGYVYNIGKYEVTNAQYAEFLNAVAASNPNGLYHTNMAGGWNDIGGITRSGSNGSYTYTVRTNRGNRPVNYVSWYDALRFANWLHNGQPSGPQDARTTEDGAYDMSLASNVVRRTGVKFWLPSEDEWYKAAYYKGGGANAGYWDYPTQSNTAPTAELPVGTDTTSGSANYYDEGFLDTTYYTTEVGEYSAKPSDSVYGSFDQGGNLQEWNETPIGWSRGLRGGSFGDYGSTLHARYRYYHLHPGVQSNTIGFRVASIPEPGSIVLLLAAALALAAYAHRRRPTA